MEAELKGLLKEEADRRQAFIGRLLDLIYRWKQSNTTGETSVYNLVKELQNADDVMNPLLVKCQALCLEDVSRKESTRDQRDSGFTPSSDMGAVKRQAVFVPVTELSAEVSGDAGPCVEMPQTPPAAPEGEGDQTLPQPKLPTQHTDESSDADSASS